MAAASDSEQWRKNFKPLDEGAPVISNMPPGDGGAQGAQRGDETSAETQQLSPAKSGKLESKERISSMLQSAGVEGSAQPDAAKAKGKMVGCFGSRKQGKESSKPCVIF